MSKHSELKAAALAATSGPWILDDDSWSDGDNANVSTEERYDGRIVSIAQIEGGGSESGFDEPFSAEQQANARYITAANPAVVLSLLAELEAKDKRIAELEGDNALLTNQRDLWYGKVQDLEAKLATPVRLPEPCVYEVNGARFHDRLSEAEVIASLREQGFTVEGDGQ